MTWDWLAGDEDPARAAVRDEMLDLLRQLVETRLTSRQREIVELYFTDGLTQAEIAVRLGIAQQVVSKQLFGVMRNGKRIGGAIRRLRDEVEKLGAPTDELVTVAAAEMASDDRNVRVKMLRLLALFDDARATSAVLAALSDPARRVRDVAIKSTRPHHMSAEVVARLRSIVDDESEVSGLRRDAFFALSSSVSTQTVPEVTREAVIGLMDSPRFRLDILVRLCESLVQPAGARSILQEFVNAGSTEEAVMATRALCGHVLMPVNGWMPNDVRHRVRATYDPAPKIYGVPRVWIPRDDAVAIVSEVYPPPS